LYHPDRNPGREAEFNAKFQAIQAANEILSDPKERIKYDTERLRAGYGKNYVPSRANTQRKSQPPSYPPRPAATPTPSAKPQYAKTPPNGPSAGARRYASHARAGPQQWKSQDTAETRADAYAAFANMRGGNKSGWQGFDPATGRASASTPGPGAQRHPFGASAQSTRPKSAFEAFQNAHTNAQAHSTRKKQGFAPGAAGGDEPMARNTSAYSSSSRTERPSSQYFEPAPPPTAKKPAEPELSSKQHQFTPEFERSSRIYAQAGRGEKTFVSGSGLGRSQTLRTPSGSTRPNANANTSSPASGRSGRHRSASPKARRNPTNYDSTSSSESEEDMPKPKAVPKSRLRPEQKFADFHRQHTQGPRNGEDLLFSYRLKHGIPGIPDFVFDLPVFPDYLLPLPHPPCGFYPIPQVSSHFETQYTDCNDPKGHTSDSAAFPKSSFRPDQADSSGSSSSLKYAWLNPIGVCYPS
jgi:curved DNA-binding protein CbpA